jgi:flavin reductase (DIM6/NTAB) family NADH-FMN oxidoreductase RutF
MADNIQKQSLRRLTYGLYILTALEGGEMAAGTVSWLSQASFKPPLIMVAIKAGSRLHNLIERSGMMAVNVLAETQKEIASVFIRPSSIEGEQINGYAIEPGPCTGAPLLKDLPAWFEARVTASIKKGDHTVFVAEVVNAGLRDPAARSLTMQDTGWHYGG